MSKKNGKEDGKKGKKPVVHARHPELGTPGQASRDERVVRNLLQSKDIAGASLRIQASAEVRAMVERIAASETALSAAAGQALALPGTIEVFGEVLVCVSDEKGRDRVLERLTGTGAEAEAMRSRITNVIGNWEVLFRDDESIMNELLARFRPKEGADPDLVVNCALLALSGDEEVGRVARELNGVLSIPSRKAKFREMLGNPMGIPNAAQAAEKDTWDRAALEELSKEASFVGMDAGAALCYKAAYDKVFYELWRSRETFAGMQEFIAAFARRISEVMESVLVRECFTKLGECSPEDVRHWIETLAIQQQTRACDFIAACDWRCVVGALTKAADEFRCYEDRRREQAITEFALLNIC